MNYSTYTFNADDGKKLIVHQWKPHDREPAAIVHVVHGMAEHTARYEYFAQTLTYNGFLVTGFDQRGHGQTDSQNPGLFSDSDSFHRAVRDLQLFSTDLEKRCPGLPVIMYAHSMGSFITQRCMQQFDLKPSGIIYSGSSGKPPVELTAGIWVSSLICKIFGLHVKSPFLHKLTFGKYNRPFRPARTPMDWLSRDEENVDRYIADPLCGFTFSASFYHSLFKGLKTLHNHKPFAGHDPDIPVLLLSGGSDPVSDMAKGVENLEHLLTSSGIKNVRKKIYPHGRHEMLNEINRDEVIGDVAEWCLWALNRERADEV